MSFLPQDYEAPRGVSFYMKIEEGDNLLRILSQPVLGWEDWENKKPYRFRFNNKPAKSIDPKKPVKHFWDMIVWNYREEQIQILHITQASIKKSLETYAKSKAWGAPNFYDINIVRTGKDKDSDYQVIPMPPKPVESYVIQAFKERPCNLEASFDGGDCFDKESRILTKGIFSEADLVPADKITALELPKTDIVTAEEAQKLDKIISECSPGYQENYKKLLKKAGVESTYELPRSIYVSIQKNAFEKRAEYIFDQPSSMDEVLDDSK